MILISDLYTLSPVALAITSAPSKSLIINLSVLVILMLSGNQRDVLPPRYRVFGTNRKLTARPKC